MFAAYTPIEKCVGKEVRVRAGGEEYVGMLAGVYTTQGLAVMVLTPKQEGATELHIPVLGSVIWIKHA